ncbi:MAG TPA: methyltransferase domain-containing protein [Polyangiaceae bacterium]|nr:methyltransferase domain-containing protein [Polyangiaceae bacterium]
MSESEFSAEYYTNHERRDRFPWTLYHRPISRRIASIVRARSTLPTILIVGCGLEPYVDGVREISCAACDIDPRAIEACKKQYPRQADRFGVSPSAYELPSAEVFDGPFDMIVAKDVVEHVRQPERWARMLAQRLSPGGELLLSTPNYGTGSTLGLLERTVLEWVARRDGYSRRHIHPSRFDAGLFAGLNVGDGMELMEIWHTWNRWAMVGRWRRK